MFNKKQKSEISKWLDLKGLFPLIGAMYKNISSTFAIFFIFWHRFIIHMLNLESLSHPQVKLKGGFKFKIALRCLNLKSNF